VGTARAVNHPFLGTLGVDHAVDYTTGDPAEAGPYDVVVDLVGGFVDGAGQAALAGMLASGGRLVSVAGPVAPEVRAALGDRAHEILVEPDLTGLRGIAGLAAGGSLAVHVARVFPLEEVTAAHDLGRQGHVRGKIVLTA
jgi:NADPH:quinone reductase-like Zn-dependent oxidoreductase